MLSSKAIPTADAGAVAGSGPSPLAEAIGSFLLELRQKPKITNSIFYKEVLVKAYNINGSASCFEDGQNAARDLAAFVEDAARRRQKESKMLRLASRIRPLIDGLGQFTTSCDVMIQAAPDAAAVIYGGARLVLQLAQNLYACQDAIATILAEMGDLLKGYRLFSSAHEHNLEMRDALVSAYKNIVRFWHKASELLNKRTYRIAASAVVKPLNKEWETCQRELRRDREKVLYLDQALQATLRMQESLEAEAMRQTQLRSQIADWIRGGEDDQNLHCHGFIQECVNRRHPNTCDWLFKHAQFETWLRANESTQLLVLAPPGAGKTILASAVNQMLESQQLQIVAFFCVSSDPAKGKALTVLRALAIGLLAQYENPPDTVQRLFRSDQEKFRSKLTDIGTTVQVLKGLVQQIPRVHIILDGLDECSEQSVLLQALRSISDTQTLGIVKWFFTARPEPAIRAALSKNGIAELMAPRDSLMCDIREFMKGGLNRPKCDDCIDSTVAKSEGIFLVAYLTLRTLNGVGMTCEEDIEEELVKFPRDLRGCYMRSLENLSRRSVPEQNLARKLFAFIVAAAQPLRLSELLHALAATRQAEDFLPKRLSGVKTIEQLSSNLIAFDKFDKGTPEDPMLRFIHKSVQDFFQQSPESLDAPDNVRMFFLSRETSNSDLGKSCLQYLSYKRYSRPNNVHALLGSGEHAFLRYAATFWYRHLSCIPPSPEIIEQVQKFLKSKMFWNCVSVQSHVAPHLHSRFEQHSKEDYDYGCNAFSRPSSKERTYYASPIPEWIQRYDPAIVEDVHSFIMEWHHVLNFSPHKLDGCLMDEEWTSRWPCKRTWESKKIERRNVNAQSQSPVNRPHQAMLRESTTNGPLNFAIEVPTVSENLSVSNSVMSLLQPIIEPVMRADSIFSGEISTRPMDMSWHLTNVSMDQHDSQKTSVVAAQWILAADSIEEKTGPELITSGSQDDLDFSDDGETDNESLSAKEDLLYSAAASDADSIGSMSTASLAQEEASTLNCIAIPREQGKCIEYTWYPDQTHIIARSSVHPTKPLIFWSPSFCEFCVVDRSVENENIQSAYLPEPEIGLDLSHKSLVQKEFYYSRETDQLYYLLLAAKQGTFGTEMRLCMSTLEWRFAGDGTTELHRIGQVTILDYETAASIQVPFILTTWTSQHVVVALPSLAYNPKIVRLSFPDKDAAKGATAGFETLREPIFFPSSTPDHSPQLHYLHQTTTTKSKLTLTLLPGNPTTTTTKSVKKAGSTSSNRNPTTMTWEIDETSGWRPWDPKSDAASEDEKSAKRRVERLRGSYVDRDQRFHAPVRSGLDWRKKADLTCS